MSLQKILFTADELRKFFDSRIDEKGWQKIADEHKKEKENIHPEIFFIAKRDLSKSKRFVDKQTVEDFKEKYFSKPTN